MRLEQILPVPGIRVIRGDTARDITGVAFDSRRVVSGNLFVALRGQHTDGHAHIGQAIASGAVAILCETPHPSVNATIIEVEDSRSAMAVAAANFHRHPSRSLKVCGVTGTNGKTTTAFLVRHLLDTAMMRCGLLGTIRYEIGGRVLPAPHTTPESAELQSLLGQMVAAGCKAVSMEVSSHALDQGRVDQIAFDVAVFTNLTQDHLDYHGTMDSYFAAKRRLFEGLAASHNKHPHAVLNFEDPHSARLRERMPKDVKVLTYGMGSRADFRAGNFQMDFQGMTYQLQTPGRSFLVRLPLIGRFNIYNSLAALAAASALGVDMRPAVCALADAPQVPGRLEAVPAKRAFRIFVDYAHSPDALVNALRTLRELNPRRVLVVFGCGGDRDRTKRPLMARAVEEGADYAVLTSDNPRTEDPEAILADVRMGFRTAAHETIADRKEAIFKAVALAGPRDIVLIAGKGHETYQEIDRQRLPFSDSEVARWALEALPPPPAAL